MGLFDRFKKQAPVSEPIQAKETKKSRVEKNTESGVFVAPTFMNSIPDNKDGTKMIEATTVGWVYACASAIADSVARTKIRLYRTTKEGPQELEDHPLLDLLFRVNDFTTYYDHIFKTLMYLEATGEAPWYIERSGKTAKKLLLLRPDRLQIVFDAETIIGGYIYRLDNGTEQKIDAADLIFLRNPSLTSEFRGSGTLQAAAITVDTEEFAEKYNRNFFFNGARPDIVLETESTLKEVTIKRLKAMWTALYQGVDNSHKMAVLEQGLKFRQLGVSQKDMDFMNQLQWSRDKILAIFRVPKSILGITEDVNLASAKVSEQSFLKFTVVPRLERLIQQLNEFLVPQFGEDLFLEYDDPVPQNRIENAEYYKLAIDGGWMTPNEVRDIEGLPELQGGDSVLKPVNLVPAFSLAPENRPNAKKERVASRMRHMSKETVKDKQERVKAQLQPLIKEMLKQKLEETKQKKKSKKLKHLSTMLKTQAAKWQFQETINVKSAQRFESGIKDRFVTIFQKQQSIVLENLDKQEILKAPGLPQKLIDAIWDKDAEVIDSVVEQSYAPLFTELLREQVFAVQAYFQIRVGDLTSDPSVAKTIRGMMLKLVGEVNDSTRQDILDAIGEGVEAQEGINQIRDRVQGVFAKATQQRAELIARTETIRGSNFAAEEVYRSAGVRVKEWITAKDERTCQWCSPMDGRQLKISQPFFKEGDRFEGSDGGTLKLDYSDTSGPPLHPNCRCTLGPVIEI